MMDIAIELTTLAASAGIALFPLTKLADKLLLRKYEDMDSAWKTMLDECVSDPEKAVNSNWLARQRVAFAGGKLCRERAYALQEAGYVTASAIRLEPLPSASDEKNRFSYSPSAIRRTIMALLSLPLPLALAIIGSGPLLVGLGAIIGLLLALVVICDLRARIIPYQLCIAFGIVCIPWVAFTRPEQILASVALAIASHAVLMLVEKAAIRLTSASAIGAGDCRIIPLICFLVGFQGLMPGLIGLCVVAGSMALWAILQGRSRRSYLPFAPALYAFAIAGALYPFLPIAGIIF